MQKNDWEDAYMKQISCVYIPLLKLLRFWVIKRIHSAYCEILEFRPIGYTDH